MTCTRFAARSVAGLALTVTLGFGLGSAVSAATGQEQADAAIAAFTEQVTAAGFESTGPGDEGDVLDLRPSDDDEDPMTAAINACFSDIAQHVAEDGAFVGETARATSDVFALSNEEGMSTDPLAVPAYDEFSAVVAVVDDPAGITAITDAFASEEMLTCLNAATEIAPTTDPLAGQISFGRETLELGDQAVVLSIAASFSADGVEQTYNAELGLARVGQALAIVMYTSTGEPLSELTTADALTTLVDALG